MSQNSAEQMTLLADAEDHLATCIEQLKAIEELERTQERPIFLTNILSELKVQQPRLERRRQALLKRP